MINMLLNLTVVKKVENSRVYDWRLVLKQGRALNYRLGNDWLLGKSHVHNVDEVVIGSVNWLLNWLRNDWLWNVSTHDI
jgi:hypothetical protein